MQMNVFRCCSWCTAWNRHGRNFLLSCLSMSSCHRQTVPVSSHSVTSHCIVMLLGNTLSVHALLRLYEQRRTILVRSNLPELTHFPLMNAPCSNLHSFCAAGVSSGLATRVIPTRVTRGKFEVSINKWRGILWFQFCTVVRDSCWVAF
jgi:hypothetical protein